MNDQLDFGQMDETTDYESPFGENVFEEDDDYSFFFESWDDNIIYPQQTDNPPQNIEKDSGQQNTPPLVIQNDNPINPNWHNNGHILILNDPERHPLEAVENTTRPTRGGRRCDFELPKDSEEFRDQFFKIFYNGKKKKFRKKLLKNVHDDMAPELNIKVMSRSTYRDILYYFIEYLPEKNKILKHLEKNRDAIIKKYPTIMI